MDGVKIRSFGDADQTPGPWSTGGGRQKRLAAAQVDGPHLGQKRQVCRI
jgi:hypothetical protein